MAAKMRCNKCHRPMKGTTAYDGACECGGLIEATPAPEKNLCGKARTIENPYEVWQTPDGSWTWNVLKKWQSPSKEKANPYARWFCGVRSPFTYGGFELGDVYVQEITRHAIKVFPVGVCPSGNPSMVYTNKQKEA